MAEKKLQFRAKIQGREAGVVAAIAPQEETKKRRLAKVMQVLRSGEKWTG
jgi:hypothetical protein